MEAAVSSESLANLCQAIRSYIPEDSDWTFPVMTPPHSCCRLRLKCDGTRAETRYRLSAKRTSPFTCKSSGTSVQSTTGSRGLRISDSNAEYTMFRVGVKSNGYPLHSPVSPSLPPPCATVCHHVSTGLYHRGYSVEVRLVSLCHACFPRS